MRHKIGDLVYHPNISPNGSLGEIVEIKYNSNPEEASWFGDEIHYYVDWHEREERNSFSEDDITTMKRWLYKRTLEDAT
jgi:hypothetical protein